MNIITRIIGSLVRIEAHLSENASRSLEDMAQPIFWYDLTMMDKEEEAVLMKKEEEEASPVGNGSLWSTGRQSELNEFQKSRNQCWSGLSAGVIQDTFSCHLCTVGV